MIRNITRVFAVALASSLGIMPSYAEEASENGFVRTVLLEEFTTENCSNCPAAAEKLHSILQRPEYEGKLAVVCHHVGFLTDWLTLDKEEDYEWLYNSANGSTGAPAMMIDRVPTLEEKSAVFGMTVPTEEVICAEIDKRLAVPSPLSVSVSTSVSDGVVTVHVSGEKTAEKQEKTMVTVYLVENNVASRNQSGADKDYVHQHVTRAFNSVWGDPIKWEGNEYSYECSFNLEEGWKLEDMEIVAMVNRDIPSNVLKCEVVNAASAPLAQDGGVAGIADDGCRTAVAYYDMQGRRLRERPSSGMCITVYSDGKAEKSFRQ